MKKIFVSSDLHGFMKEWTDALNEAGFDINNKDHVIVICGDALDRGPEAKEIIEFLNALPDDRKILIRGNHEDLLIQMLIRGYPERHDRSNGTWGTFLGLCSKEELEEYSKPDKTFSELMRKTLYRPDVKKYLDATNNYAEIGNYIFVHGWIPCEALGFGGCPEKYIKTPLWRAASKDEWEYARWYNGMEAWAQGAREDNKTIVCGHWHSSYGHHYLDRDGLEFFSKENGWKKQGKRYVNDEMEEDGYVRFDAFKAKGIIALDGCTALSHIVNVETIEVTDEDWENRYVGRI